VNWSLVHVRGSAQSSLMKEHKGFEVLSFVVHIFFGFNLLKVGLMDFRDSTCCFVCHGHFLSLSFLIVCSGWCTFVFYCFTPHVDWAHKYNHISLSSTFH